MLEYSKTMTLLDEMKPHYDDGFTSSERSVIENLYNKSLSVGVAVLIATETHT